MRYAAGALACAAAALAGAWAGAPAALLLAWPAVSLTLVALNYAGLGARGLPDRPPAAACRLRRACCLAPYLLGARLNARIWTRGLPPAREVRPGLWLASLERLGARPPRRGEPPHALLSLCAELPVPRALRDNPSPAGPMACRCWTWCPPRRRGCAPRPPASRRPARPAWPVVVACALGFSRSVAAMACWLVRHGDAAGVDDALQQIRRVHPQATLDEAWLKSLHAACAPAQPYSSCAR